MSVITFLLKKNLEKMILLFPFRSPKKCAIKTNFLGGNKEKEHKKREKGEMGGSSEHKTMMMMTMMIGGGKETLKLNCVSNRKVYM